MLTNEISYSAPDLRCKRSWKPLMLQCLNIVRDNMFVIYKDKSTEQLPRDAHKDFILSIISVLRGRPSAAYDI